MDTLNFDTIMGRPIVIMWSKHQEIRISGVGNLFISNLHKDITTSVLYDTFSVFGHILSCKVKYKTVMDLSLPSKECNPVMLYMTTWKTCVMGFCDTQQTCRSFSTS